MSRSKPANPRNQSTTEEEMPLIPLSNVPKEEKEAYWLALVNDLPTLREVIKPMPFFALLNEFPPAMWEKHLMIYMYRLDPEVRNRAGEKKYIQRVTWAIDEEWVKEKHGGGKYELYLKCGDENLKQIIFSIDGQPKLLPGQTVVGQEQQPVAAGQPAGRSELADAIDATSRASNAGIDLIKTGMQGVLEMQQKVAEKAAGLNGAPPANSLDELVKLTTVLKALQPAAPVRDPIVEKLLEAAVANMTKKENPEPAEHHPTGELALVKEAFGVDSIRDLVGLFKGGGPKVEPAPWWSGPATSFIERLPNILGQVAEMQRDAYERALHLRQIQNLQPGQQLPPGPPRPQPQPQPTIIPPVQSAPPANGEVTQATVQQAFPAMIQIIASAFDQDRAGDFAAETIDFNFPGVMQASAELLGDQVKLSQFVANVPMLAARAAAPTWKEFQEAFVAYVSESYPLEPAPASTDGPKAVSTPGAA